MYTIYYEYRNPYNNHIDSGIWVCNCLQEVYAFTGMVERYGGNCSCDISKKQ